MKRTFTKTLLILAALLPLSSAVAVHAAPDFKGSNRYLIRLRPGADGRAPVGLLGDHGLVLKREIHEIDLLIAEPLDAAEFERKGFKELQESPDVLYIEKNAQMHTLETPNDPLFSSQDGLKRLQVENAWNRSTGSQDVVVAVSDTGIDFDHEDLKNQIWANPNEIPENGVDDDGNGYIDDVRGWDFAANDNDPRDENRHGTHVSGIISAEGNNGKGVAGVTWHTRLMSVRFLDQDGSGTTEGGIDTILYASKMGARIINASWGGGGGSKALSDAIGFAWSKGTLLVAAAGNDAKSTDLIPQIPSSLNLPGIVSVASSASDGVLSSFSNFGVVSVDVVAPGSSVLSTLPGSDYGRLSGTSMATPMVSGVGALILALYPDLSAVELRNAILNAVVFRDSYNGKISTSGDINAELALTQFDGSSLQVWPKRVTLGTGVDFQFTARGGTSGLSWSVSDSKVASISSSGVLTPKSAGTVIVTVKDSSGVVSSTETLVVLKAGGGGGGCSAKLGSDPIPPEEAAGSALSFGLPLLGGFLATRRRRRNSS